MRTLLIVDDHAGFRRIARTLLENAGFCVVGEAASSAEALEASHALRPDVVLLDVQLPDADGFATVEALYEDEEHPDVVLVSSRSASDYAGRIERSPAMGFISKGDLSGDGVMALLETSCG